MLTVSLKRIPAVTPTLRTRSDPAKSTKWNFEILYSCSAAPAVPANAVPPSPALVLLLPAVPALSASCVLSVPASPSPLLLWGSFVGV